jgi:hypothetical protein
MSMYQQIQALMNENDTLKQQNNILLASQDAYKYVFYTLSFAVPDTAIETPSRYWRPQFPSMSTTLTLLSSLEFHLVLNAPSINPQFTSESVPNPFTRVPIQI